MAKLRRFNLGLAGFLAFLASGALFPCGADSFSAKLGPEVVPTEASVEDASAAPPEAFAEFFVRPQRGTNQSWPPEPFVEFSSPVRRGLVAEPPEPFLEFSSPIRSARGEPPEPFVEFSSPPRTLQGEALLVEPFVEFSTPPGLRVEQPEAAPGSTETAAATLTLGPYPVVLNSQVQHFLDRFTGQRREVISVWLNRSSRYLGMIRQVLRSRGLPEELAFTAMIESGFNPMAVSRAGAAGLWQFMAATGRRYGLRVDQWVDERFDPEKSTFAAAAYLGDLYKMFGCWKLAQAGYNAGEMTVVRAMRATGKATFWDLAKTSFFKRETKEFVPQIQAATHIGLDPLQYGFELAESSIVSFESIVVPPSTDLRWLATTTKGVSYDDLRILNGSLIRGVTPPGTTYMLKVPVGTGDVLLAAAQAPRPVVAASRGGRQNVSRAAAAGSGVHIVRPRDTVSGIAHQHGVSVNDVIRWNGLERADRIRPGDRLRVTDRPGAADRRYPR